MKSDNMRESSNVEDRRGQSSSGYSTSGSGGGFGGMGLGLLLQMLLSGRGGGKWLLILLLGFLFLGGGSSLGSILNNSSSSSYTQQEVQKDSSSYTVSDDEAAFLSKVLASTEDFWTETFKKEGLTYHAPTMVLYSGSTQTGCGTGNAAAGPFYCPTDKKVYIDTSFYRELTTKYHASGDFAMAYVIAHEVGHHIQTELGIMDSYNTARRKLSETQANQLNVRLELQADYYAGAWAKYVEGKGLLDVGDVEEAMEAAHAVGDDTLQEQAYGRTVPDSFTHGTSKQRQTWFYRGYQYGDLDHGDTFNSNIDNP